MGHIGAASAYSQGSVTMGGKDVRVTEVLATRGFESY